MYDNKLDKKIKSKSALTYTPRHLCKFRLQKKVICLFFVGHLELYPVSYKWEYQLQTLFKPSGI